MIDWFKRNFTAPGLAALGVLIGGTLIFLWILWAIEQARANQVVVRAITPAEHCACAAMPRGNQEMEEEQVITLMSPCITVMNLTGLGLS